MAFTSGLVAHVRPYVGLTWVQNRHRTRAHFYSDLCMSRIAATAFLARRRKPRVSDAHPNRKPRSGPQLLDEPADPGFAPGAHTEVAAPQLNRQRSSLLAVRSSPKKGVGSASRAKATCQQPCVRARLEPGCKRAANRTGVSRCEPSRAGAEAREL